MGTGLFLYMLICAGAANCPNVPIYSKDIYFSEQSCREDAPKVAVAMHYRQGGDWSWKCIPEDYVPKEIKP